MRRKGIGEYMAETSCVMKHVWQRCMAVGDSWNLILLGNVVVLSYGSFH